MSLPSILSVVCGQASDRIAHAHGDYLDWFVASVGRRVDLVPWKVLENDRQPALDSFAWSPKHLFHVAEPSFHVAHDRDEGGDDVDTAFIKVKSRRANKKKKPLPPTVPT